MPRNHWPITLGTGGRITSESVAGMARNIHKLENARLVERLENHEELMEAQGKVFALLQALDAGSDETKVPRTEMTSLRVLRLAWA